MDSALRYERSVDLDDGSSVSKLLKWINRDATVLEFGPATGYMTEQMKRIKNATVDCVEIDAQAAEKARKFARNMLVGDLEQIDIKAQLIGLNYAHIVFADVLEHLLNPLNALRKIKSLLQTNGEVLASIPNIGHAAVVLDLIQGKFEYKDQGLLDHTHLRFFTRNGIRDLFDKAGFEIIEWDRTSINPESSEFSTQLEQFPEPLLAFIKSFPDWNTYQFLVRAVVKNSALAKTKASLNVTRPNLTFDTREVRLVQLFFDFGDGFSEANSVKRSIELIDDGVEIKIEFLSDSPIQRLRLDPLDTAGVTAISLIKVEREADLLLDWTLEQGELSAKFDLSGCVELTDKNRFGVLLHGRDPALVLHLAQPKAGRIALHLNYKILTRDTISYLLDFVSNSYNNLPRLLTRKEQIDRYEDCTNSKKYIALSKSLEEFERTYAELKREHDRLIHEKAQLFSRVIAKDKLLTTKNEKLELLNLKLHQNLESEQASQRRLAEYHIALSQRNNEINQILSSSSWKITRPIRSFFSALRAALKTFTLIPSLITKDMLSRSCQSKQNVSSLIEKPPLLTNWIDLYTPTNEQLLMMRQRAKEFSYRPLISVIMPVYNTPELFLRQAIDSVLAQTYDNWELCISDDCSAEPHVGPIITQYASSDPRIKISLRGNNGHISENTNSAIELSTGEFLAFFDHDDLLAAHALSEMVCALNKNRELDIIYSNEDKVDERGNRSEPTFKPKWSPDYFRSFMYLGHLALYRRSLVERVGSLRVGYEGSQDYDLALRAIALTDKIEHIPGILYHWRMHSESVALNLDCKDYAYKSAQKALADSINSLSKREIKTTDYRGIYSLTYRSTYAAMSSQDAEGSLESEIEGVGICIFGQNRPAYIQKNNAHTPKQDLFIELSANYLELGQLLPKSYFTDLAQYLEGSKYKQILLMADSISPESRRDLSSVLSGLLGPFLPKVGVVAAKLLLSEDRIFNAGYTLVSGKLHPNFAHATLDQSGYAARLLSNFNLSVVGLHCLLVDKELLLKEVKQIIANATQLSALGFSSAVCLRAIDNGMRVVWTPNTSLLIKSQANYAKNNLDYAPIGIELEYLNKFYDFSKRIDQYYPRGLKLDPPNFEIDLSGAADADWR